MIVIRERCFNIKLNLYFVLQIFFPETTKTASIGNKNKCICYKIYKKKEIVLVPINIYTTNIILFSLERSISCSRIAINFNSECGIRQIQRIITVSKKGFLVKKETRMINAISIKGSAFEHENFLFDATDERSACERVRKDRFVGMHFENAEYLMPRSLNHRPRPIDAKHGDVVAVLISVTAKN